MLLNNRYRIIRTLGSGGFGETYLAEDTQMPSQRRCVIKQLKPIHANTSPNRVFFKKISKLSISDTLPVNITNTNTNNYFWLSQRRVTEADLVGKDGYELDIMRNTVFAVNGRRFDTPGLQEYFNQQSWYNPRYSPKQFPINLLSKLEQQNVEYIAKYQDSNNLRHFKK